MNKKTSTRTAEIFIDEAGILRIKILEGVTIDLDDAVDNFIVVKRLSGNQPKLKLWDARVDWKIKKEAREYLLREDFPGRTIARAVLVKSLTNKLILNFILNFNRSQSPLKIFTSEEEAIKWLNSFKN